MGKQLIWATYLLTIGFLSYFSVDVIKTFQTDEGQPLLHNNTRIIAMSPMSNSSSTIFTLRNNVLKIQIQDNDDTQTSINEMEIYKLDGLSRLVYVGDGAEILLEDSTYAISLHPGRYTVNISNHCNNKLGNSDCSYRYKIKVSVDGKPTEVDINEDEYRTFIHHQLQEIWDIKLEGYTNYDFYEIRRADHLKNLKLLYYETIFSNLNNGDTLPHLYINGTHAVSYVLRGNGSLTFYEFRFYPGDFGKKWYLINTEHLPPSFN